MYKRAINKKTPLNQRFWRINNWQMWLFGIIIPVVVFFYLFRFVRAQLHKNEEQKLDIDKDIRLVENQNPSVLQTKLDKITSRTDIQKSAKDISHNLGVKYSDAGHWYDFLNPRGWTENDKKVADIVIYQRNNYKLLEKLYYEVTNSRTLTNDLLKLLDDSELNRLRKYKIL